jgi:hypothetical protein
MKSIRIFAIAAVVVSCILAPGSALAAEVKKAEKPPKPYPLDTCPVSGEKLGSMGEPVVFVHQNQEIQLCCKGCRKDFDNGATKFMSKIEEANKKVKPYKQDTCLYSGEPLGAKPRVVVFQFQEVKFCCRDCEKEFRKDPKPHLAKLAK